MTDEMAKMKAYVDAAIALMAVETLMTACEPATVEDALVIAEQRRKLREAYKTAKEELCRTI